ncbi:hypothetical protein C4B63_9g305 [Trypanosoma cruzi]|uniref:Signal recognition particle receptor subunit beta n=1 Tax=Trypanosoma cruzi TaxID=5693 RepID=A0A2V2VYL2_TRYCR|nr:hypothetical protein C4B63_9g305 [Trypanosoma cruzi]
MTGEVPEIKETNAESGGTARFLFFGIVTVIAAFFIARFISRYVFGAIGVYSRHRHTLLLIGLCGSGKTALFAQLVAQKCVSARTSMQPNRAVMTRSQLSSHKEEEEEKESSFSAPSRVSNGANTSQVVVDFPGHRRLRDSLLSAIEEAMSVVVVVDAVTIQDDRQEGAQALAELIFSVLTSSAFYGVQRVLVACTKRDELTSYSAKAVRKLLEAEITRFVTSRRGDLQSLDTILNSDRVWWGTKRVNLLVAVTAAEGMVLRISCCWMNPASSHLTIFRFLYALQMSPLLWIQRGTHSTWSLSGNLWRGACDIHHTSFFFFFHFCAVFFFFFPLPCEGLITGGARWMEEDKRKTQKGE